MTVRCSVDSEASASSTRIASNSASVTSARCDSGVSATRDLTPAVRAARIVDHEVAGDGEHPRARRRGVLLEDPRRAPRPQQRLLHDVVGPGAIAGQVHDVAPHRRGVGVVSSALSAASASSCGIGTSRRGHETSAPKVQREPTALRPEYARAIAAPRQRDAADERVPHRRIRHERHQHQRARRRT